MRKISIELLFTLSFLFQPIDTPFPEPSTSSGGSRRPGELYKMSGFSQDLPTAAYQLPSTSPQSILQRLSVTSHHSLSPSSSSSEIDVMRNRILQMQTLAMTEKEVCQEIFVSFVILSISCSLVFRALASRSRGQSAHSRSTGARQEPSDPTARRCAASDWTDASSTHS